MEWDCKKFQNAATKYLVSRIEKTGINEREFCLAIGLPERALRDAKWGRKNDGNVRSWTAEDLCRIANYFKESPYYIIYEIEKFYHENHDSLLAPIPSKKKKQI